MKALELYSLSSKILSQIFYLLLLHGLIWSSPAFAGSNQSITYQGLLTDSSDLPITTATSVTFKIYESGVNSCLLWSETQSITPDSKGRFSAVIGLGTNTASGAITFEKVFRNLGTLSSLSCSSGSTYTPLSTDDRLLTVVVGSTVLSPSVAIKAVPFATQSAEVGGYSSAKLFKVNDPIGSSNTFSQSQHDFLFNLAAPAASTATPCADNQVLKVTSGAWTCAADQTGGGGGVTGITAGTGLTGGTITSSGIIGLGTELAGLNTLSSTGFVNRTGSGSYSAGPLVIADLPNGIPDTKLATISTPGLVSIGTVSTGNGISIGSLSSSGIGLSISSVSGGTKGIHIPAVTGTGIGVNVVSTTGTGIKVQASSTGIAMFVSSIGSAAAISASSSSVGVPAIAVSNGGIEVAAGGISSNQFISLGTGTVTSPMFTNSVNPSSVGMYFPTNTDIAFATAAQERMRIGPTGNVGIGNSSPTKLLHVGSSSVSSGLAVANFQNADGTCSITPASSGSGIACSSDERLKENFKDVSGAFALDRILQLQAVTYNFKTASTENRRTGYKAQEVMRIAPEFVRENDDGYLQVYYDALIPWITEAIKSLYAHLTELDSSVAAIKAENAELKAYICAKDPQATFCR